MAEKRIINLTEATELSGGDYLVVDSASSGTRKVSGSVINSAIGEVASDLDTLSARVDQIIAPSGEAPSAAEVSDARVGADGVTYTTLGGAIRTQVTDLKSDINLVEENLLFDGSEFLSSFSWEKYGGAFNGASYSNGELTIPSGSTGKVSYLGVNLLTAGDFSKLVNKFVHVRIKYSDLGTVVTYPYLFTNSAYTTHVKTISSSFANNTLDYWLTLDTAGMSYIFVGIRVHADSPSQSSSITISIEEQSGHLVDFPQLAETTKANDASIETIMGKLPKERTTAVVADSTNSSLFMYSTGKVLSIGNAGYKIKVYPVTNGNYYNFYSDGFSLADSSYVALAFSTSANVVANAVPEEILFRPSTTASVVDIDYYCQKSGYIWAAQAPSIGEILVYNTQIADISAGSALNFKGYKKILTIGDSLTNATGGGDSTIRWQNILTSLLKMEGHSRSGAIGLTVADIGGGGSIYSAVQALTTEADVDIISFWGGTNDWSNDVPLGNFDTEIAKATSDATTFYGACIECVKKIITLYPAKRIFCVGTTPRYINVDADEYSNDTPNGINLYLLDYVDALKKVAEYFGLPFLDLYRTSGINKLNISQYMFMQTLNGNKYYLHFSVDGEYQIAYRMAGFISKIG